MYSIFIYIYSVYIWRRHSQKPHKICFILSFPFFIQLFCSIVLCLMRCDSDHLITVSCIEVSSSHMNKLESRGSPLGFWHPVSVCFSGKIIFSYKVYSFTSSIPILMQGFWKSNKCLRFSDQEMCQQGKSFTWNLWSIKLSLPFKSREWAEA